MAPRDALIPGTCESITVYGKRDLADSLAVGAILDYSCEL